MTGKKLPDERHLFRVVFCVQHLVAEGFAGFFGGKKLEFKSELLPKILADILNDFLFGGGGKAGDGNPVPRALKLFKPCDEVPDVKVVGPKVVSPGRKAVRFINHKARDAAC